MQVSHNICSSFSPQSKIVTFRCAMCKNVSRTVLRVHLEKWINPLGQLCDIIRISWCNVDKHSQLLFECCSSQLEIFCYGRGYDQLFWERAFWIFAPWHIFTNCTSLKVLFLDWGLNELHILCETCTALRKFKTPYWTPTS